MEGIVYDKHDAADIAVADGGDGEEGEARSLAGRALLNALRAELDGVDFTGMRSVHGGTGDAIFKYAWCEPVNRFLDFLGRRLKMSAAASYHDAVKYLIFRTEHSGQERLEVRAGRHRFDLVDVHQKRHEVKTRELKHHRELAAVIRRFVRLVQRDVVGREVWWLSFLRECKDIKARPCTSFLGLLRLPAVVARSATRRADFDVLVKELVEMADGTESKLLDEEDIDEEELEEGFLFGVENKITKDLRRDVMSGIAENKKLKGALVEKEATIQEKEATIQEKEATIQEKEATIQEKEATIQEKEATIQEKEAENQRLKDEIARLKRKGISRAP